MACSDDCDEHFYVSGEKMQKMIIGLLCSLVAVSCVHGMDSNIQKVTFQEFPDAGNVEYSNFYTPFLPTINNMVEDLGGSSEFPIPLHNVSPESFGDTITLLPHFLLGDPLLALTVPLQLSTQLNYVQRRKIRAVLEPLSLQRLHALVIAVNYLDAPIIMLDTVLEEYAERLKNMSVEEYAKVLETISNDLPTELVKRMYSSILTPVLQYMQSLPTILGTLSSERSTVDFTELLPSMQAQCYALAFAQKNSSLAMKIYPGSEIETIHAYGKDLHCDAVPFVIRKGKGFFLNFAPENMEKVDIVEAVGSMLFSPDGNVLIFEYSGSGNFSYKVYTCIYDLDTHRWAIIDSGGINHMRECAFSSDGKHILVTDILRKHNLTIYQYDKKNNSVQELIKSADKGIVLATWHPQDNSMIAYATMSNIGVLLLTTNEQNDINQIDDVKSLLFPPGVQVVSLYAVSFSADGRWIIGACETYNEVICVRWSTRDLDAPGTMLKIEKRELDLGGLGHHGRVNLNLFNSMLPHEYVLQIASQIDSNCVLLVFDFYKNRIIHGNRSYIGACGYGNILALCENITNSPLFPKRIGLSSLRDHSKKEKLTEEFLNLTTHSTHPFAFFSEDGSELITSLREGTVTTIALYGECWSIFFAYLKKEYIFSLKELHQLYCNYLAVRTQEELSDDQVFTQLMHGMSDVFIARMKGCIKSKMAESAKAKAKAFYNFTGLGESLQEMRARTAKPVEPELEQAQQGQQPPALHRQTMEHTLTQIAKGELPRIIPEPAIVQLPVQPAVEQSTIIARTLNFVGSVITAPFRFVGWIARGIWHGVFG
jgi:hypothetical protein